MATRKHSRTGTAETSLSGKRFPPDHRAADVSDPSYCRYSDAPIKRAELHGNSSLTAR